MALSVTKGKPLTTFISRTLPSRHSTALMTTVPRTFRCAASFESVSLPKLISRAGRVTFAARKIGPAHVPFTTGGTWAASALAMQKRKPATANNRFMGSPPLQFIAQHLEVISIGRLHEIKRRATLANQNPIARLQSKANLTIESQRDFFFFGNQAHFND